MEGPGVVNFDGFSLHVGVSFEGHQRNKEEPVS